MKDKYKVDARVFEQSSSDRVSKSGPPLKNAIIDSLMINNETVDNCNVSSVFYKDPQCTKNTLTLHVYNKITESWQTEYSIYSRDKFKAKPEWYRSCIFNKPNSWKYRCSLYGLVTLEKPDHLYSYEKENGHWLFNAHSSINFSSKPHATLTPLPACNTYKFEPRLVGAGKRIYLYQNYTFGICWTEKIKGFSENEYKRGIYYYNCDIDKWFPVPEMKTSVSNSYIFSDHKLVYLIGGVDSNRVNRQHYVQAYDYRVSQWLEIPNTLTSPHGEDRRTLFGESDPSCCAANGKIYLANHDLIQAFDPVACKWEKFKEYDAVEENEKRDLIIAADDNLLWVFQNLPTTNAEICDLTSLKWSELYSVESLHEDMYDGEVSGVVVFKPLEQ
jgi:hypothetical protein